MASGDRTGPMGQGPRTGRALGHCSGYEDPGYTKGFGGRGRGLGFGFRGGRGHAHGMGFHFGWPFQGYVPENPCTYTFSEEDEIKLLKSQRESLEREQKDIEKRLDDLEKPKN